MITRRRIALRIVLGVVLGAAAPACGPSSQQVKVATAARYAAPTATIFELAEAAARDRYYKIGESDVMRGAFITIGKWYSPDGQSETAGVGNSVAVEDGSLNVALLVEVSRADDGIVTVAVTPIVERFRLGVGVHERVKAGDASLPGWVQGKADALAVAIHERARAHAAPAGVGAGAAARE